MTEINKDNMAKCSLHHKANKGVRANKGVTTTDIGHFKKRN
jgi:hypothetical protein